MQNSDAPSWLIAAPGDARSTNARELGAVWIPSAAAQPNTKQGGCACSSVTATSANYATPEHVSGPRPTVTTSSRYRKAALTTTTIAVPLAVHVISAKVHMKVTGRLVTGYLTYRCSKARQRRHDNPKHKHRNPQCPGRSGLGHDSLDADRLRPCDPPPIPLVTTPNRCGHHCLTAPRHPLGTLPAQPVTRSLMTGHIATADRATVTTPCRGGLPVPHFSPGRYG